MQSAQFQLHAEIEDRHWWFVARREIFRRVIAAVVPPGEGHVVLDVGCGTGANLGALAADYTCVGIDTSSEAIRLAGSRFPQVEYRQGFAPDDVSDVLPQASLVILSDVLEHVSDDFALFSSIFAATQPGTHFLVTVPADLSLWSQHDESFGHYRRYDPARFQRIWDGLPVSVELESYYNSRLYPLVKLVRWWNRRQGKANGAAGTDFNLPPRNLNRMLEKTMAAESHRLLRLLANEDAKPYRSGVSLMALLKREPGRCVPRVKPAEFQADYFDPQLLASSPA
jgi:2-polyprenyl-3-methyl-5-hydroxy-6-metoxy-1,4-benzoquinol methylase